MNEIQEINMFEGMDDIKACEMFAENWKSVDIEPKNRRRLVHDFKEFITGKPKLEITYSKFLEEAEKYLEAIGYPLTKMEDEKSKVEMQIQKDSVETYNNVRIPDFTVSTEELKKIIKKRHDVKLSKSSTGMNITPEYFINSDVKLSNSNKTASAHQEDFRKFLGSLENDLKPYLLKSPEPKWVGSSIVLMLPGKYADQENVNTNVVNSQMNI